MSKFADHISSSQRFSGYGHLNMSTDIFITECLMLQLNYQVIFDLFVFLNIF